MVAGDDFVQLLDPAGNRVDHPDFSFTGTDAEIAASLRDMVLTRRYDAEATALQRKGELGLWPPSLGQEAAQVGSAKALTDRDQIVPSYREHGVAWVRGVDLVALLNIFRGSSMVDYDSRASRFHLYSWVIGAHLLSAVGMGMALQRDGLVGGDCPEQNAAVITYFGDGATSQGDLNEALVFAASFNAPVVFFCQNNHWAISVPTQRQSRIPLYLRGSGFGIPGVRVDGNDVLAVHAVTEAALDRARSGGGPTLIEAETYRMGPHTTSDDPTRYRSSAEVEDWVRRDPITRLAALLRSGQDDAEQFIAEVEAEAEAFGVQVREVCKSLPDPDPVSMFDHVYVDPHTQVEAERAWFTEYYASLDHEGAEGSVR